MWGEFSHNLRGLSAEGGGAPCAFLGFRVFWVEDLGLFWV